jgi:hypothetical protein
MRAIVLGVVIAMAAGVAMADPGWGQLGANSGPFTSKPFYGGATNVGAGYSFGLTSFPDAWAILGGHAIALDGFAATESSAGLGVSASVEKVPDPRDWVGVIVAGPDKWSAYLKVMTGF